MPKEGAYLEVEAQLKFKIVEAGAQILTSNIQIYKLNNFAFNIVYLNSSFTQYQSSVK